MQKWDAGFLGGFFDSESLKQPCHTQYTFTIESIDEIFLYFYSHRGIKEIHTTHFALKKMFYLEQAHAKSFIWIQHMLV